MNKTIKRKICNISIMIILILLCMGCGKKDIGVGDYVEFGKYEQDNDNSNGQEPIKWQVLDIDDDKALLIADKVLDNVQYCEYAGIYGDDK